MPIINYYRCVVHFFALFEKYFEYMKVNGNYDSPSQLTVRVYNVCCSNEVHCSGCYDQSSLCGEFL